MPIVLFAITTWKEKGKLNACFHSWDKTAFFAIMENWYQHTHTYAKIQRGQCFYINFLAIGCYDKLIETIIQNEFETDAAAADDFTLSIHATVIQEAFANMECTLKEIQDYAVRE